MSDYSNRSSNYSNPQNNTLAIISLVAGILGLTFLPLIGSIAAVITGPMAKREIADSNGVLGGENLAQIGMILGWIGVALGVLGCCITIIAVVIPFLLTGAFFFTEGSYWIAPALLGLF